VRTDRFKLIENFVEGERRTQLFDLDTDPGQTTDCAEDPDYAEDLQRLRSELTELRRKIDDPLLAD